MSPRIDVSVADEAFHAFVGEPDFPCLAGRGAINAERYGLGVYGALGSARSAQALALDLRAFVATIDEDGPLRTFVAVFPSRVPTDELAFEERLWAQLTRLAEYDPTERWDPKASTDPRDDHFAFSFAGKALFVIGLHAGSSRLARRFRWPTLVFNPHVQFERLKADGRFEPLREAVRERDIALQGSINPNLTDFGEASEARQYSGRAVEADWHCPFHAPEHEATTEQRAGAEAQP